jgi:glycosyltransferase involved in cell wall biosynthesis
MHVVMLVQHDAHQDSRVVREAEATAAAGHTVEVISRRAGSDPEIETRNGVRYHNVPSCNESVWRQCIRLHIGVGRLEVGWLINGPRRTLALFGLSRHITTVIIAAAVGPFVVAGALGLWLAELVERAMLPRRRFPKQLLDMYLRLTSLARRAGVRVCKNLVQPFVYLNGPANEYLDLVLLLRPDVIHAHDLATVSTAMLAARILSARVVYDAHELERHTNYWSLNRWTRFWIAHYETAFASRCDAVVTVCDSIADWLARQYEIDRPVVVCNAPVIAPTWVGASDPRDDVRSRLGLAPRTPLVVYVGSVTIDRGMDLCVRALAHLPGAHFTTVGSRYHVTADQMMATARELGVTDRLHFIDPVPPGRVVEFISSADCSVMAIQDVCLSYYYSFPNKLLESVLAGLPVVVANLFELRRFVEQYRVGVVVDQRDPCSIARGLREVLDVSERYRPSVEIMAAIARRYGWEEQKRKLVALYSEFERDEGRTRAGGSLGARRGGSARRRGCAAAHAREHFEQ